VVVVASVATAGTSDADGLPAIDVTGNATNVSFSLQERAFAGSQNLSDVTAELDDL